MYFNFNYVTDPPNDELVNNETQLNENWTEVANKIDPFNHNPQQFPDTSVLPKGTEAIATGNRVGVWNGSQWCLSLNHVNIWTTWQTVGIRTPTVIRPGYPVVARISTALRRVELSGGVLFDSAASAWPTNTTIEITSDVAINSNFTPVNGSSIQQGATGAITTAGGFASAVVIIEQKSTPTSRVGISVRYQGSAGGGNFIMLDGIGWWY